MRTIRMLLRRRPDFEAQFKRYLSLEVKEDSSGAVTVMMKTMTGIGWTIDSDLNIKRRGGDLHLFVRGNGTCDHMARSHLRNTVLKGATGLKRRNGFSGIRGNVCDEAATMKLARDQVKPRERQDGCRSQQNEREADGTTLF